MKRWLVAGAVLLSLAVVITCSRNPPPSSPPRTPDTSARESVGPLFFDPQGADFTGWVNHFRNEVYRNWIIPQAVLSGTKGHVDFEFTVERDGSISATRFLKSSGTPPLDHAALRALTQSRFMVLPAGYGPARVIMQVGFVYNQDTEP